MRVLLPQTRGAINRRTSKTTLSMGGRGAMAVSLSLEQTAQRGVAPPERQLTGFAQQRPPIPGRFCVHRTTEHPFHLCNVIRLVAEAFLRCDDLSMQ
jgi:hypothetical protein